MHIVRYKLESSWQLESSSPGVEKHLNVTLNISFEPRPPPRFLDSLFSDSVVRMTCHERITWHVVTLEMGLGDADAGLTFLKLYFTPVDPVEMTRAREADVMESRSLCQSQKI